MWRGSNIAEVKALWAEDLAGYTSEEIIRGIAEMKTRPWPPTLPEFLLLCRPLIEPQTAFLEACSKLTRWCDGQSVTWSRPEVFWAAKAIGSWDFRNVPYKNLEARWKQALADAPGDAPPEPPKKLSAPFSASTDHSDPAVRERVAEGLKALGDRMKRKPVEQYRAPRRFTDEQAIVEAEIAELERQKREAFGPKGDVAEAPTA